MPVRQSSALPRCDLDASQSAPSLSCAGLDSPIAQVPSQHSSALFRCLQGPPDALDVENPPLRISTLG